MVQKRGHMRISIEARHAFIAILLLAGPLLGTACDEKDPSLSLLPGGEQHDPHGQAGSAASAPPLSMDTLESPELEGLRKRMAIRQHVPYDGGSCMGSTNVCPSGFVCRDPLGDRLCVKPCGNSCGPGFACMSNGECGQVEVLDGSGDGLRAISHCQWLMREHPQCSGTMTTCEEQVCIVMQALCGAHVELEMAGLRSAPVAIRDADGTLLHEVPPQSSATNVTLANVAFLLASQFAYPGAAAILADPTAFSCTAAEIGPLASTLVEAYHVSVEAVDVAVEANLAVSDSLFAEKGSFEEKANVAIGGDLLSRAAAIHHLVGGRPGLPGFIAPNAVFSWPTALGAAVQQFALCDLPPLTPQADSALKTLREAAVNPLDVVDEDIDINTLVNGASSMFDANHGSVRDRLREFWNASATDLVDVPDQVGLRLDDFEEARAYLREELIAFNRSPTAELPKLDLVDGEQSTYTRFASTGTLAPQRDPMYWVTVGQHQDYGTTTAPDFTNTANYDLQLFQSSAIQDYGLAGFIDTATEIALKLVSDIEASSASGAVKGAALDPILLFLADAQQQRRGRLRYAHKAAADKIRVTAECLERPMGALPALLVKDEAGLQCAVNGNIEGDDCSLSGSLVVAALDQTGTPSTECPVAQATSLVDLPAKGTRLYLVEPLKPSLTSAQPGNYRALASIVAPDPAIPAAERWAPIVPDLADRAARILAPSRKWCTRPQVTCADEAFDARLPLEDELTDDGDAVESSWRHFLELARQAADEADLLGEGVVNLNIDTLVREETNQIRQIERAEQSIEELQDLCGIDMDPTEILRLMSTDGTKDFNAMRGSPCTTTADCGMGGGTCLGGRCTKNCTVDTDCDTAGLRTCVNGVCGLDPFNFSVLFANGQAAQTGDRGNAQRLADCLGDQEIVEFVTAGNKNLCAWVNSDNRNILCENGGFGKCPVVQPTGGCETPPGGRSSVLVTEKLGYIDLDEPFTRGAPLDLCEDIRRLRRSGGEVQSLLQKVVGTNFFDPAGDIGRIGGRLGWDGEYGGYSSIRVGDQVKYSTGNPFSGAATTGWPCDPMALPSSCTEGPDLGDGLFCDHAGKNNVTQTCSDPDERSRLNHRMMRAVIAARDLTVRDGVRAMESVGLPMYASGGIFAPNSFNQALLGANVQYTQVHGHGHRDVWGAEYHCLDSGCDGPAWLGDNGAGTSIPYFISSGSLPIEFARAGVLTRGATVDTVNVGTRISAVFEKRFFPGVEAFDPGWFLANLTTNFAYGGTSAQPGWGLLAKWLEGASASSAPLPEKLANVERLIWSPEDDCLDESNAVVEGCDETLTAGLPFAGVAGTARRLSTTDESVAQLGYKRSRETMLDGLELLCESEVGSYTDCGEMPLIGQDPHDLRLAEQFLHCIAGEIRRRVAFGLFARVPRVALDALRQEGAQGAFPRFGGDMATAITDIREGLVGISGDAQSLAATLDGLATDMRTLRNSLEIEEVRQQIKTVEFMSTVANQLAQCQAARAPTVSASVGFPPSFGASVSFSLAHVAICANATAQIQFSRDIKELDANASQLVNEQSLSDFQRQFEERAERMSDLGEQLAKAQERLDGGLASIEKLRNRGRRLLAKALFMDSDILEAQTRVNAASRARLNTARVRYEQALRNARRMAFIARRAIEQRLGVDLTTMSETLPLVDAPSTWVDAVCDTSGFNFAVHPEAEEQIGDHYAAAYIGDYVTKLENLIESYRMVNNFHEGRDTAIVSLRDDVSNSRAMCPVPVGNFLYHAGQLDHPPGLDGDETGWVALGCGVDENTEEQQPNCVGAFHITQQVDGAGVSPSDPIPGSVADTSDAAGYVVRFGPPDDDCDPAECGFREESALAQTVDLEPGTYRLSWYGRGGMTPPMGVNAPIDAVQIMYEGDTDWTALMAVEDVPARSTYWSRYFASFEVEDGQSVTVGIRPEPFDSMMAPYESQEVYIAALMLEDITGSTSTVPKLFANTSSVLERDALMCEDTSGAQFRRQFWRRGCLQLCDDGLAAACTDTNARTHCFREYQFSINPRAIDVGKVLNSAGFARGNFNYRIEDMGVNLVGTNIRNCENSPTPSSCYAGGFVPFSLEHLGPYRVRNYQGADMRVELFPGIIEHARALAAERYLTNPLSSADQQLIEPYYRHELRGRPLDGNFVLRIWEEDAVDFDAIEDVQLVLNYRYWTRFQ